ncbi:hypothetical protein ACNF49_53045 [Actinomadura sp. ATCC 39365]
MRVGARPRAPGGPSAAWVNPTSAAGRNRLTRSARAAADRSGSSSAIGLPVCQAAR